MGNLHPQEEQDQHQYNTGDHQVEGFEGHQLLQPVPCLLEREVLLVQLHLGILVVLGHRLLRLLLQ